ncbi:MAG: hypothetical protein D6725_08150, partial [Planctomycetota bacterium]
PQNLAPKTAAPPGEPNGEAPRGEPPGAAPPGEPHSGVADHAPRSVARQAAEPPRPGSAADDLGSSHRAERADDTDTPSGVDQYAAPDTAGVVGRLMERIRCTEAARPILEAFLGRTWVVETLSDAWNVFRRHPGRFELVTLQGERIDRNGVVFAGTISAERAVVRRRSERRSLENRLLEIDRQAEQYAQKRRQLQEEEAELDVRLRQLIDRRDGAAQELSHLKQRTIAAQERLEQCLAERRSVEAELNAAEAACAEFDERIAQCEQQIRYLEEHAERTERAMAECERAEAEISKAARDLEQRRVALQMDATRAEQQLAAAEADVQRLETEHSQLLEMLAEARRRRAVVADAQARTTLEWLNTRAWRDDAIADLQRLGAAIERLTAEHQRHEQNRRTLQEQITQLQSQERAWRQQRQEWTTALQACEHRLHTLEDRVDEEFHIGLADAAAAGESAYRLFLEELRARRDTQQPSHDAERRPDAPAPLEAPAAAEATAENSAATTSQPDAVVPGFEEVRPQIEERVQRLRKKLKALGNVNPESLADLESLEQRYTRLKTHLDDLTEARTTLDELLRKINVESKRLFVRTLESIRENFRHFFRTLFGGGSADVVLENPDDVLECGIDIVARPPGKELRSISLLSGGEKTLTAIGLLFAIFRTRPSPFCILDEVDAALDEANIERYIAALGEFRQNTQFIMITHRKRTMRAADVLYGITMEESGVSKKLSVRWEDVDEQGNIRRPASE